MTPLILAIKLYALRIHKVPYAPGPAFMKGLILAGTLRCSPPQGYKYKGHRIQCTCAAAVLGNSAASCLGVVPLSRMC